MPRSRSHFVDWVAQVPRVTARGELLIERPIRNKCAPLHLMLWVRVLLVCAVWIGNTRAAHAVTLRCEPCTVPLLGTSFRVTGTFADSPFAVAIVGHAKAWKLGALELHDVALTARGRGELIEACVTGDVGGVRVRACSRLPHSPEGWTRLRAVDVTWQLVATNATGHGSARLTWTRGGDVRIEHGTVELVVAPRTIGGVAIGQASVAAEVDGDLSRLAFELHGRVHVASVLVGGLSLRGLEIPLELRTESERIVPQTAIVATLDEATLVVGDHALHFSSPTILVHDVHPFAWAALAGDEHRLTWTAIGGLPVDVGSGSVGVELVPNEVRVTSGQVQLLGGELVVAPFSLRSETPFDVAMRLDGLSVAQVVSFATGGHVVGSGALDGQLVVHHDASGFGLERATVHARSGGELHVREPRWPQLTSPAAMSLQRRLAIAFTDLQYDRLTCVLQPPGHDPEAILSLHGRATRVPQEIDLAINLRGVRALVQQQQQQ